MPVTAVDDEELGAPAPTVPTEPTEPMADAWAMGVRRRRRLMIRVGIAAVVVVVLVIGAVAVSRWMSWQSPIDIVSSRTTVDGAPVADAGDGSPVVVPAKDDRIITIELGFDTPDPVEITEVAVSVPARAPVRPFAVQSAKGPLPEQGEQEWGDFEGFDPTSEEVQQLGMQLRVILSTTTAACSDFAPGSTVLIDEIDVTYQARSRTRHRTVPLPSPISVEVPDGACR